MKKLSNQSCYQFPLPLPLVRGAELLMVGRCSSTSHDTHTSKQVTAVYIMDWVTLLGWRR